MMKITKGMAQKLYNKGEKIMILPNRVKAKSLLASWITKPTDNSVSFEQVCNAIHYYNCSPKNGTELAYYAEDGI